MPLHNDAAGRIDKSVASLNKRRKKNLTNIFYNEYSMNDVLWAIFRTSAVWRDNLLYAPVVESFESSRAGRVWRQHTAGSLCRAPLIPFAATRWRRVPSLGEGSKILRPFQSLRQSLALSPPARKITWKTSIFLRHHKRHEAAFKRGF